jgi:hypothetical protein
MGETEFIKKNDAVDCIVFHFLVNIFPSGCMMHRGSGEAYAREIPKKKKVPQWFLVKFGCTGISRDTN